jgi:hypothetical protein
MKLIIDRERWLRGEGADESYLLRSRDSKMCCLGFFGLACNLTENQIINECMPNAFSLSQVSWNQDWLFDQNNRRALSQETKSLLIINDTVNLNSDERERRIKEIFARHNVEVEFVN